MNKFYWTDDEIVIDSRCEMQNGFWYKTYQTRNMHTLSCEILYARLPENPYLIKSEIEYCKFSKDLVEIQVKTENYPTLFDGFQVEKKDIIHLIKGLAYLELNGLVHGDIKPDNIVRTGDGLSMIDFSYMVSKSNNLDVTQGYKDEDGINHDLGNISKLNPLSSAIFALGISIKHLDPEDKFLELTEILISENRPSSFLDVLRYLNEEIPFVKLAEDFDYLKLETICSQKVKKYYNLWIENEGSLVTLFVFMRLILDRMENLELLNYSKDLTKATMILVKIFPHWVTFYPDCSGKFLTLGMISLVEKGVWKSCEKHEEWEGNIDDEIGETSLQRILVATRYLDFIIHR